MGQKKISDLPAASAITGAELVELAQSGTSVQSTINAIKNGAVKVYRALLSQTGTAAPVATILENTLGGIPVWSRASSGHYAATLTGAFPLAKTFILCQADYENSAVAHLRSGQDDANAVLFFAVDGNELITDLGPGSSPVQILVYP